VCLSSVSHAHCSDITAASLRVCVARTWLEVERSDGGMSSSSLTSTSMEPARANACKMAFELGAGVGPPVVVN